MSFIRTNTRFVAANGIGFAEVGSGATVDQIAAGMSARLAVSTAGAATGPTFGSMVNAAQPAPQTTQPSYSFFDFLGQVGSGIASSGVLTRVAEAARPQLSPEVNRWVSAFVPQPQAPTDASRGVSSYVPPELVATRAGLPTWVWLVGGLLGLGYLAKRGRR